LNWSAAFNTTNYNVKRSLTGGAGTFTTIASPVSPGYTDGSVANGTLYYYVVFCLKWTRRSANSSPASATPMPTADRATNGTATASSDNAQWRGRCAGFDGSVSTKWYDPTESAGWLQYNFGNGVKWSVTRYDISSASDVPSATR